MEIIESGSNILNSNLYQLVFIHDNPKKKEDIQINYILVLKKDDIPDDLKDSISKYLKYSNEELGIYEYVVDTLDPQLISQNQKSAFNQLIHLSIAYRRVVWDFEEKTDYAQYIYISDDYRKKGLKDFLYILEASIAEKNGIIKYEADYAAAETKYFNKIFGQYGLTLNKDGDTFYGNTRVIAGSTNKRNFCRKFIINKKDQEIFNPNNQWCLDNSTRTRTRKIPTLSSSSLSYSRRRSTPKSHINKKSGRQSYSKSYTNNKSRRKSIKSRKSRKSRKLSTIEE